MNERLKELRQKEQLTDTEINKLITLSPLGSFGSLPNLTTDTEEPNF